VEAMASLVGDAIIHDKEAQAAPHGVYRCSGDDRWCAIAVFTDEEWRGFKKALGNPPWAEDKRFTTLTARLKNKSELDKLVEDWTKEHTAEEAMALLQKQGVAAGVVQSARDLAQDPHLKQRGFFIELSHPQLGKTVSDAVPVRLSDTPPRYTRAAPVLGQDNGYVYGKLLGLSQDELAELKKQAIV
jgi:crotonobetainyl-CoA:carnitine CoA-transferase CaiB-like acyl-CoA transferase